MAQPFVGQVLMVPYNFAPQGWAFCMGQLLPIAQNDVLFNLIGTTYGGDGQQTFALPDLRSRVPIHTGQGPGTSNRVLGENGGEEAHTLTQAQMPAHNHVPTAQSNQADQQGPAGNIWAREAMNQDATYSNLPPDQQMRSDLVLNTGGSQPHSNIQPYLAVNFVISLFGIFPSQG